MTASGRSPNAEPPTGESRLQPTHEVPKNRASITAKAVIHDLGPFAILNNTVQKA
jgi:hypothetical protein